MFVGRSGTRAETWLGRCCVFTRRLLGTFSVRLRFLFRMSDRIADRPKEVQERAGLGDIPAHLKTQ